MKEKLTFREMIARIAERAGISKKLSGDMMKVFQDLIETGLERDGEVRITGLGIFRLKWVKARRARNLKTGESLMVPAHNKVVFNPEKGLKEKVNEDFKFLTYTVLEEEEKEIGSSQPVPKSEAISGSAVFSQKEKEKEEEVDSSQPVPESEAISGSSVFSQKEEEKGDVPPVPEKEEYRRRKLIWWIIPLIFIVIALLIVIFYMRNCQDKLEFSKKDTGSQEQVILPSETSPAGEEALPDTTAAEMPEGSAEETAGQENEQIVQEAAPGFPQQTFITSEGKHLFQVARETYGNPFLWALIYKENSEKISDPEQVLKGVELVIPSLDGTPARLSVSDSTRVAEGYRMLYEYYNSKGDERARNFYFAMRAYTPN